MLRRTGGSTTGSEPPYFAAHHSIPVYYGQAEDQLPEPVMLPVIDASAARRPHTPGMPPLNHVALPAPDELRLIILQAPAAEPVLRSRIPARPEAFPVPEMPRIQPLTVAAEAPAPSPEQVKAILGPTYTRPAILDQIDPLFAYLVYLALGLGTLFLDLGLRYVIMSLVLIVMGGGLSLLETTEKLDRITVSNLVWGGGIGLVVGLPLLVLVGPGLSATNAILFPELSTAALLQLLAITGPLGETLFFRGVFQDRRGFAGSVIAAGISSALFYWPAAAAAPVYLGVSVIFSTALAAVYSYVKMRYGIASAALCQVTANMMLLFLPGLLF